MLRDALFKLGRAFAQVSRGETRGGGALQTFTRQTDIHRTRQTDKHGKSCKKRHKTRQDKLNVHWENIKVR